MTKTREILVSPIFSNNPIAVQILGICSALAVTSSLKTALVMSIALTLVTAFSNLLISLLPFVLQGHPVAGIARLGGVLPAAAERGRVRGSLGEPRCEACRQITRRPVVVPHPSTVCDGSTIGESHR